MSIILKGIDIPEPIKGKYTYLELYVRSDGVVFDDDFEEVGKAIRIPKGHGDIKDVGKLEDELDSRCGQLSAEIVRNAPMILEAEE